MWTRPRLGGRPGTNPAGASGNLPYACDVLGNLTDLILWAVHIGTLVISVWAFVDCLRRRPDAFPAIGRQSKPIWLALTGGATLVSLLGFSPMGFLGIAAIVIAAVYLLDVRPRIAEITNRRW